MTREGLEEAAFWDRQVCLDCLSFAEAEEGECGECGSEDLLAASKVLKLLDAAKENEE